MKLERISSYSSKDFFFFSFSGFILFGGVLVWIDTGDGKKYPAITS